MTRYEEFKEVVKMLGVVLYGLPTSDVGLGTDMYLYGSCILVDSESDVRLEAESLPVEIFGRVTEHWGVRNRDGSMEIFVMKMEEMYLVDEKVTPHKHSASLLSLLIRKGANLIVLHDKISGTGCICGAFVGSRMCGERTDFVRPKPFADYDPYGESEIEACMVDAEFGDMLKAMRELAMGKPESTPEEPVGVEQEDSAHDEPELEPDEQSQVVEAESEESEEQTGETPDQASEDDGSEGYSGGLSKDEINCLLNGGDLGAENAEAGDDESATEVRPGAQSEAEKESSRTSRRKNHF